MLAFLIYNLLKEYEIYSFRKKIYRIRSVDSVSLFVRKVVKKTTLEKIDAKLQAAGCPFGLTPEVYILVRVGLFLFSIIYVQLSGMSGIQAVLMLALGAFGLDFYLQSEKKSRMEKFRRNMPEIVDMFELGAAADVPLEEIFLIVSQSIQDKEVKDTLTRLAADYIVSREKRGCLQRFCDEVGLPEANVLAMTLLQGEKTGKTLEILSTLSSSLFNTAASRIARQDKAMEYKVLVATFFLMASVVSLYIYPYFTNIEGGLKVIF